MEDFAENYDFGKKKKRIKVLTDPPVEEPIQVPPRQTEEEYNELLAGVYSHLTKDTPEKMSLPTPSLLKESNKKVVWANFSDYVFKLGRQPDHISSFIFVELGCTGSVDGKGRLIIRTKLTSTEQFLVVIRKYLAAYVMCVACKRPDTTLRKGVDRVNYVVCSGCGATTAVEAIKSGYHATTKKDRIEQRLLE